MADVIGAGASESSRFACCALGPEGSIHVGGRGTEARTEARDAPHDAFQRKRSVSESYEPAACAGEPVITAPWSIRSLLSARRRFSRQCPSSSDAGADCIHSVACCRRFRKAMSDAGESV
jgi:hypothetical protein